jgi:hypothetical protein
MKNLSNTKKILLGVGALVAGYYIWNMWKSYQTEEKNKKIVASAIASPTIDPSASAPTAFTEA